MGRYSLNLVIALFLLSPGSFFFVPSNENEKIPSLISIRNEYFDCDYSTYFGEGHIKEVSDTCIDNSGYIYIVGTTQSSYFPTSPNAYQPDSQSKDAFVAKIDPKCQEVVFSTYLGGSGVDFGKGICVDDEGYVYVTGYTSSDDFPTTEDAFNRTNSGYYDIFVTKFTPDGSDLVYSTYIGGNTYDWAEKIEVDNEGSAYIVGSTDSMDFPVTRKRYSYNDNRGSLVITKINRTGSSLDFSINIGSGWAYGNDIVIDEKKNTYVTGYTRSTFFFVTEDSFDVTHNGYYDVIVVKLDPSGELIFSTFVGGSFDDIGYGIDVDSNEDIYVTGETSQETLGSYDFPVTSGAFKTYMNSTIDAFVFKMNRTGSSMEYSTYLGGDAAESGMSIDLDENNNAIVTGHVSSEDYHTTYGAFSMTKFGGARDAFLTVMNGNGSDLKYSTYLGGSGEDFGRAVHYRGNNTVLIAGYTKSNDFPVSLNAIQTEHGPNEDGFVTILNLTTVPFPPRNLTYEFAVSGELNLSWDEPIHDGGSPLIGYNIYRAKDMEDFIKLNVSCNATHFNIQDHDPTSMWKYYVTAVNEIGESLPSNIAVYDDLIPPFLISDNTPHVAYTGDPFEFSAEITDNIGLEKVNLEVYQNESIIFNGCMKRTIENEWTHSITVPDSLSPLRYRFNASDYRGNLNITSFRNVSVWDNDPPRITLMESPDHGTTGDEYKVTYRISDNINVLEACMEISQEEIKPNPIPMEHLRENIWVGRYDVPPDSVSGFDLRINASDGTNANLTDPIHVNVSDNDPPTLLANHSDLSASNGKEYHLSFEIEDNIGVTSSWCLISFDEQKNLNETLDGKDENMWSGTVTIPKDALYFSYSLYAVDDAGNLFEGDEKELPVSDNMLPFVIDDMSPSTGYTGDPYEFKVKVGDNRGVLSVEVEYQYGNGEGDSIVLSGDVVYTGEITILPGADNDLEYRIVVFDPSHNRFTSIKRTVNIIDNDPPSLNVTNIPEVIGTGAVKEILINVSDNIEPDLLSVEVSLNGKTWYRDNRSATGDIESVEILAPRDRIGNISIVIRLSDTSGNWNVSGPFNIMIKDIIPPEIQLMEDLYVTEGDPIRLNVSASDNIGISIIDWIGFPYKANGTCWEGRMKKTGEYNVTIRVFDEAGNWNETYFMMYVKEKKDNNRLLLILTASAVVVAVLVSLFLYYHMKKKKIKESSKTGSDTNPNTDVATLQEKNNGTFQGERFS